MIKKFFKFYCILTVFSPIIFGLFSNNNDNFRLKTIQPYKIPLSDLDDLGLLKQYNHDYIHHYPKIIEHLNDKKSGDTLSKKFHNSLMNIMKYPDLFDDTPNNRLFDPKRTAEVHKKMALQAYWIDETNREPSTHHLDPMVIVHGGPFLNGRAMVSMARQLSKQTGRRVVVYTQRGCTGGNARFNPFVDSIDQSCSDLNQVIDDTLKRTGAKKVCLVAHSLGSCFVHHYLGKYSQKQPEGSKVSSAISISPVPITSLGFMETMLGRKKSAVMMGRAKKTTMLQDNKVYPNKSDDVLFKKPNQGDHSVEMRIIRRFNRPNDNTILLLVDWYKKCNEKPEDIQEILKNITVPTLIIHGKNDAIPEKNAQDIAHLIPNAQCIVMENANHFLFQDNPEEFHTLVKDFLHRVDSDQQVSKPHYL